MAPRIVQWVGDLYDAAKAYIGRPREVRIDESNWDILIHDGTTPGGHRVMNQQNADLRYQKINSEVGGLGPFPPGSRGILIRYSDTEYVLRVLQQTPDAEIIIDNNPDGFAGNFVFHLTDNFPRAKTFANAVTIQGLLTVWDQHVGGTLTVNQLVVTGGVNIPANSIPIGAIAGLDARIRTLGCPLGVIMLWNHNYGAVPAGWAVCDGSAGTVDLRDRFVVGAALSYAPGTVGGVVSQNIGNTAGTQLVIAHLPSHGHVITDVQHGHGFNDPPHQHATPAGLVVQTGTGVNLGGAGGQFSTVTNELTTMNTMGGSVAYGYSGINQTEVAGGNQAHAHGTSNFDNRPPFYAEYYIQHVGP